MRLYWPAAFLAFLVHNGEELLTDLPGWAVGQPQWRWMAMVMPAERFAVAAIGLTVLALVLAIIATLRPARWNRLLLQVFAWIMLVNAASHIALSLLTGTLMPGVVSATLLILPVMGWIVVTASRQAP